MQLTFDKEELSNIKPPEVIKISLNVVAEVPESLIPLSDSKL